MTHAAEHRPDGDDAAAERAAAFVTKLAFLKARGATGELPSRTAENYATASRRVTAGWRIAGYDPTDADIDTQARWFTETADGLSQDTVATYQQRFRTAVSLYRDPSQVPTHRSNRPTRSRPAAPAVAAPAEPFRPMIDFPFVLNDGTLTRLRLPALGLAPADADRLCAYLRTLIVRAADRATPEPPGPPGRSNAMTTELHEGMTVRDRKWGGRHVGTVVNVADGRVFVAWHGTCVEDELDPADVEACPPPPDAERWADGGITMLTPGGAATLCATRARLRRPPATAVVR